jgi:deazaflavin-dependent oxidoreductase (nitroreductase family)
MRAPSPSSLSRRLFTALGQTKAFAEFGIRLGPVETWLYEHTGGRVRLTALTGRKSLVLTTVGRKSGQPRDVTLLYTPHPAGWAVIASNFGQQHHPAWSVNLLANPAATVNIGGRSTAVTARLAQGSERHDIWARARAEWPGYDAYAERAGRDIRVFVLARNEGSAVTDHSQ